MSRRLLALLALLLSIAWAAPAVAHEERPAQFPDGTGHRPHFLGWDNPRQRVVCQNGSAAAVAALPDGAAKQRSQRLLRSCRFHSIQDAIDSIHRRNTSVYVLPGTYHEAKYATARRSHYCSHLKTQSTAPLLSSEYIGASPPPTRARRRRRQRAGRRTRSRSPTPTSVAAPTT
ncbi:hypothetical protein [Nocardioides sp.]|uniref:hypothetical protein n=1 Tax=Nocardioides sp. TaxID=35761 RepID=UPI0037835DF0